MFTWNYSNWKLMAKKINTNDIRELILKSKVFIIVPKKLNSLERNVVFFLQRRIHTKKKIFCFEVKINSLWLRHEVVDSVSSKQDQLYTNFDPPNQLLAQAKWTQLNRRIGLLSRLFDFSSVYLVNINSIQLDFIPFTWAKAQFDRIYCLCKQNKWSRMILALETG